MTDNQKEQVKKMFDDIYEIKVEVIEGGRLPTKAHASDAGFDVYAPKDVYIAPGEVVKIPLALKLNLPEGCWARVETKSGLGAQGMLVYAGVIDRGYCGEINCIATNLKTHGHCQNILVKKGEKLCQITMNPYSENFYMTEVDKIENNTDRGEGGFGSTGK